MLPLLAANGDGGRFVLRQHRVVSAGAGTGKTHALLTQYLHLLAGFTALREPLLPRSIAALTFTEKAAAEMRERLGRRLLRLLQEAEGLAKNQVGSEPDLCRSAAALDLAWPAPAHFEAARAQLCQAPIGTFHSFASSLLRRNALVAGIDPDFELLDEATARDLLGEACERAVLAALDEPGDGDELSGSAAGLSASTAELVTEFGFAGDFGLVAALCRLLAQRGEEGSQAAGLSDPYAEPVLLAELAMLRQRVATALGTLTGLHPELAGKSSERMAVVLALLPALVAALSSLASLEQATDRFERLLAELRYVRAGNEALRETLSTAREALRGAAEDALSLVMSVRAAPWAATLQTLLARAQALYEDAKRAQSALDFSDLLRKSRDLLRADPAVRRREAGRYAVLLVDEFQDTSPLQAEILSLLIEPRETAQGERPPRPLYIVGDRKQSIYGFRGADVAAYEQVCQGLIAVGAEQETLSRSHRSRPALIETTNALFARVFAASPPTGDPVAAQLWAAVGPVRWDPARDELASTREESPAGRPLVEVLQADTPTGEDTPAWPADTMGREAALLTARLRQLLDSGTRPRQIVLLLRRFTHLLRYTAALTQAGVPYYVVRGRGFFAAQEVLDLAAHIALLDDPHDRLSLIAGLRSPLCGLSDDALGRLHLASLLSLPALLRSEQPGERAGLPTDEADRLATWLDLCRDLGRSAARLGPLACLQALLDATDYLALLGAETGRVGASLAAQRIANVERLLERAAAHEARGGSLASFARGLRRDSDPRVSSGYGDGDDPLAATAGEADDVVRIMTIHQSKGLEFPIVFVAGCGSPERSESPAIAYDRAVGLGLRVWQAGLGSEARRLPTLAARRVQTVTRLRSQAESARLFYVAATRASERLIFVGESARGAAPSGTWKAQVEALRAERPDLIGEGRLLPVRPSPAPPAELDLESDSPVLTRQAEALAGLAYAVPRLVSPPGGLALSLSAAADLQVCPRRYHLRQRFRLHESEPALPALHGDEGPGELGLSQLASNVLCRYEPRSSSDDLLAQLALAGHSPREPAIGELLTRLQRFVEGELVRRLAQPDAPPLITAVPFEVPVGAVRLRDRFDWVIGEPRRPTGELHVLQFRYGYRPDPTSALAAAQEQLLGRAARLHFAAERPVSVAFCDLREATPRPRFRPAEELVAAAPPLSQAGEAAGLAESEALRLPRLAPSVCDAIGCGYRYLCYGRSAS